MFDRTNIESKVQHAKAFDKAITAAADPDEVHDIMTLAIVKQLSLLLAFDHNNINLDSRMEGLGLDSLIAIELKAWIAQTLQAAMHLRDHRHT